jgi:hypothetical protein
MTKKKAAKMLTPNERAPTKSEIRRWLVREAARYIREGVEASYRAGIAAEDSDERHEALEHVRRCSLKAVEAITGGSAFGPLITSSASLSDNVAKVLRLVSAAANGKLKGNSRGGDYDEEIRDTWWRAAGTPHGFKTCVSREDFMKAYEPCANERKEKGLPIPSSFTLYRAARRINCPISSRNPGRPKK